MENSPKENNPQKNILDKFKILGQKLKTFGQKLSSAFGRFGKSGSGVKVKSHPAISQETLD